MRISISHTTSYRYDGAPVHAVQALRLTPPAGAGQVVQSWRILAPGIDTAASYTDAFGNLVHVVASRSEAGQFEVTAQGVVETRDCGGVTGRTMEAATQAVFRRGTGATAPDAAIRAMAEAIQEADALANMHNLLAAVHERVAYETGVTDPQTTAAAAFAAGKGVCQDHAHIMIAGARALGVPARYVTGYLLLDEDDKLPASSPAHHAWAEAWIDGLGWVGFDAANKQCPTDRYVRLAVGFDAQSAAPIRGVRQGSGAEAMAVAVSVAPLGEASQ